MTTELNKNNFEEHIKGELALVDFWAPWCGPCRMIGPLIEELSNEIKDVKFGKLNVDEEGELAAKYAIRSIPTIGLFKNGNLIDQKIGVQSKQVFVDWINENK